MLHALKNQINLMAVALLLLLMRIPVCVCVYNKRFYCWPCTDHRCETNEADLCRSKEIEIEIKKNAKKQKEGKKQTEICTHTQLHSYTLMQTPHTHTHSERETRNI